MEYKLKEEVFEPKGDGYDQYRERAAQHASKARMLAEKFPPNLRNMAVEMFVTGMLYQKEQDDLRMAAFTAAVSKSNGNAPSKHQPARR